VNGPRILGTFSGYDTTHFNSISWGWGNPGGIKAVGTVNWSTGACSIADGTGTIATKAGALGAPGSIEIAIDCDAPAANTGKRTIHLFVDGTLELSAASSHDPLDGLWLGAGSSAEQTVTLRNPGFAGAGPYYIAATIDSIQAYGWPFWNPNTATDFEAYRVAYNNYPTSGNFTADNFRAYLRPPMVTHWRESLSGKSRLFRMTLTLVPADSPSDNQVNTWARNGNGDWQDAGLNLGLISRAWAVTGAPHRCPVGFCHNGAQAMKGIGNNTRQGGIWGPFGVVTTRSLGWLTSFAGLSATSQAPLSDIHFDPLDNRMVAVGYDWSADQERIFAMSPDNTVSVIADNVRTDTTCIPWPFILRRPDGQYEVGIFVNEHYLSWLSGDGVTWAAEDNQDLADADADMTAPMVAVGLDGRQVAAGFTQVLSSGATTLVVWHRLGFGATWQGPVTVLGSQSVGTRPYVTQLPTGVWEVGWQLDEATAPTRYQADHPGGTWSAA